ncbi:hypothetical protein cgp_3078 [Corynebacterium glutamicum MB001]|uniref:DUF4265 domain-containing protein n=1 Tax=Corynebacterium glutamicum (strain ATCC 13032 / DSM 20300 / JCM 1318 / BCRC 11384 / CCUG 27702 / LMG 3730 / NBRC 12168 / NCIMB 10025 / NRRL B-2784 / 534) TaxID=196627 RepID=Q8NM06_CORGL|nr:DUF4265 domain-containing protein [Corynebacterium glutamicum]AGT06491.1 hypothetical protein cgp_3078 [Corynebacterium glutamicum MB001]ARV66024.1 hypothetical protein B7P23_14600 [Corynebacterium glutamicum]ASW15090.1 hypothetical protein cgc1_3078 [Corynebacterium glutamicum]AUI02163.1 DUF4265 domain-containing protein [Corynebacterium glutamicum]AUI02979.1 DUF4265 domain-containing protein [Corynebacterium glutamicum]
MGKQEKLRIPLDVPGVESEEVGVELLAEGYYLVATLPAVAQDCALGDVVRAHHVDEVLEFQEVAVAGGNKTLRVLVDAIAADHVRAQLETLGLHVEAPMSEMLTVNIAPDSPSHGLEILLDDLHAQGVIFRAL